MNGKQVSSQHTVISADHKTMTATASGVDDKGQEFKNVEVLNRQ
jgi:hypothetical protein